MAHVLTMKDEKVLPHHRIVCKLRIWLLHISGNLSTVTKTHPETNCRYTTPSTCGYVWHSSRNIWPKLWTTWWNTAGKETWILKYFFVQLGGRCSHVCLGKKSPHIPTVFCIVLNTENFYCLYRNGSSLRLGHWCFSQLICLKDIWMKFKILNFQANFSDWCLRYLLGNCLRWVSQDHSNDLSTLIQVMAWGCQAPSHYLSQCWPRALPPYGVTRPQ